MKNKFNYFLVFALCCFAIISCKKKDSTTDPTSYPFATESVSAGKANLSQTGEDMIAQVNSMKSASGVVVLQSFAYYASNVGSVKSAKAFSAIFAAESLVSGTTNGNAGFSSILKSLKTSASDPQSLKDFFNAHKGTYTWNAVKQEWDSTGNSTQIVFNFPKAQAGGANDAQLTITYQGQAQSNTTVVTDYTGDLPTVFDIAISVSNSKVVEYSFTASYGSNDVPTSVESFVAVYPFKIGVSWSYSSSSLSAQYYFNNDTKTIVKFGGTVNGNLNYSNVDTATVAQSVLSNANAYFQVFNIELVGNINYQALNTDLNNAEAITVDSLYAKAVVAAMNKDAALVLIYADSNQKIAQAEAYYYSYQYYNYTSYDADIRFIFSDGSKGSLKSYFGTGFSSLINDYNKLVADLKTEFASK